MSSCSLFQPDLKQQIVLQSRTWSALEEKPLEQRIVIKNDKDSIEFIQAIDPVGDLLSSKYPIQSSLTERSFQMAVELLPKRLYSFLSNKLSAIVLTKNMKRPIIVYPLQNKENKKFVMFVDQNINSLGLNDWYKWREMSPFTGAKTNIDLDVFLSHKNEQIDTLQYLLCQSISLILSWYDDVIPQNIMTVPLQNKTFIKRSWRNNKGVLESKYDDVLENIKHIGFYGNSSKEMNTEKLYEFYQRLERTNFTSLYAATGPLKDFYETMIVYLHTIYLRKPFNLDFYQEGVLLDSYTHCLNQSRCLGKRKDIEKIIDKYINI